MKANICIVDDHLIFCQGLKALIQSHSSYCVKELFLNGFSLIEYLDYHDDIDLVTVDLMMPEMDGIQLLSYLKRNRPNLKCLIIADNFNNNTLQLCKNMGANGIIPKNHGIQDLLFALENILIDKPCFPELKQRGAKIEDFNLYDRLRENLSLSPREVEVIQLMLNQFATQEIADLLHLSPHTIKTHRKNIYSKMRVKNITGVVSYLKVLNVPVNSQL